MNTGRRGTNAIALGLPLAVACVAMVMQAGCARSRADLLRDRAAVVENRLQAERDATLAGLRGSDRDARLLHLQGLRLGLSAVNVSIPTVPVFLKTEEERAIGYSVLDEALGTIDWNIPIVTSTATASQRPYPALFSPQGGLDFQAIQRGMTAGGTPPHATPGLVK